MLKVGDIAPEFRLPNTEREFVELQSFAGKKVLLLFFPFAFTSVCTTELCSIRDSLSEFESLNCDVLGISVDAPFTLKKFKEVNNLNFELLSDFNKTTVEKYGNMYDEFILELKGVAKRSAFLVDESQKLMYIEILEDAGQLPNIEKIKELLKD